MTHPSQERPRNTRHQRTPIDSPHTSLPPTAPSLLFTRACFPGLQFGEPLYGDVFGVAHEEETAPPPAKLWGQVRVPSPPVFAYLFK